MKQKITLKSKTKIKVKVKIYEICDDFIYGYLDWEDSHNYDTIIINSMKFYYYFIIGVKKD